MSALMPGHVWLVGAGPGDPELLTLKAARALRAADIVLHDALVSPEILALAGDQTVLEDVGKRAGGRRTHQMVINQRLIALARQGLRVVRLKGGDPMIFGRGGEEALALAAADIPCLIVPGISAGVGGLTAAGIPVTHRTLAASVAFVTGHDAGNGCGTDWAALAKGADTLVIYMGLGRMAEIAEALLQGGLQASTPIAFIADATNPAQQVCRCTLAEAGDVAGTLPRGAPMLIVVGAVAALEAALPTPTDGSPLAAGLAALRAAPRHPVANTGDAA